MATYTAIVGDTASVGGGLLSAANGIAVAGNVSAERRNPQLAAARIRTIMNPHIVSSAVGGLLSADFTIPAEEAIRWKPMLRYGAAVWLFDGNTPIFYGWAEQPVWTLSGDCQMTLSGPWILLGRARMREAWELWDMTLLTPGTGANENKNGQRTINSDGTLTLGWPNGTVLATNDRVSVDYLLFGEVAGPSDGKLICAFEVDVTDNNFTGIGASATFKVIGKSSTIVGSTPNDVLYSTTTATSSGKQGATNLNGTNQGAAAWPTVNNVGYRCLRFELIYTGAGVTIGADRYVTLDRIRLGTREAMFPVAGASMDTAAIAKDIFTTKLTGTTSGVMGIPFGDLPQEFYVSQVKLGATDTNSRPYFWGLDPRNGTLTSPNSGIGVTGFNALEWQSPADILAQLAAIDGSHVGFYLPYNARGGYDAPGCSVSTTIGGADVGSYWLSAAPQLYYQAFPDPGYAPDYTIHTRQGAQVEPNVDAQPLIDVLYVNYQTLRGSQQSIVTGDADIRNYAYAQGFRRADDYSIQPSVGNSTLAASVGQQTLNTRRQPSAAATVTIENDGSTRNPILKGGCVIPRLATLRPGSVRIVDVAASSGLRAGYATDIEWWGQTISTNERVTLTLAQPGQVSQQRAQGKLANRIHRERRRLL